MRKIIFLFAIGLLLLLGCVQQKPLPSNQSNQSNFTALPTFNGTGTINITIPPGFDVKDFCKKDADCVRQAKCCDCGLGEYVNRFHLENMNCTGPQCLCPIALSRGECRENKCVAVALNATTPFDPTRDFYFRAEEPGKCGTEIKPARELVKFGTRLNGSIKTANPCYTVKAELIKGEEDFVILNLTTIPLQTFAACATCSATIPWLADIYNYQGDLEVYYDGRKVLSDLDVFCGWNIGECSADGDCKAGGCYKEVCQSRENIQIFTNCDPRDCYDSSKYNTQCGCVNGRCSWR